MPTSILDPPVVLLPILARNDLLNSRYRVAALLGSGRWSQTYLIQDIKSALPSNLHVMSELAYSSASATTALAAKVYSAHATAEGVNKGFIRELDAFQCFLADDSDIFDLPCLKDHFTSRKASLSSHAGSV